MINSELTIIVIDKLFYLKQTQGGYLKSKLNLIVPDLIIVNSEKVLTIDKIMKIFVFSTK